MQNNMSEFKQSPRIYNLFPRIIGKIPLWNYEIPRIKMMNFNWIFINPITEVGVSGSLYSIKNYFKLNTEFAIDEEDQLSWNSFKTFIQKAHNHGIKVMLDLVLNHTSIDMVSEHENWYKNKWAIVCKADNLPVYFIENYLDNSDYSKNKSPEYDLEKFPLKTYRLEYRLANPYVIDPTNTNNITVWNDLAEIDYDSEYRGEIIRFWEKVIKFYIDCGVDGFRCDAAYKINPKIWKVIIEHSRLINPNVIFWAETLGGPLETYGPLGEAGFNYFANSSKYWDFTHSWCIEQYNGFRKYAPSISFPESHDTLRLCKETQGRKDVQIFKYFFSSFFSAGVMVPYGYEFGFRKKLHVVETHPEDNELSLIHI